MNCEECENAFAAAVEGLLERDGSDRFAAHLAACPSCRKAFEESHRTVSRLREHATRASVPSMAAEVADLIIRQQALQLKRISSMHRRIASLAAAAVFLVGVGFLADSLLIRSGRKVYADDLKPVGKEIERSKTATWKTSYYTRFLSPGGKKLKWVRSGNNDQRNYYKAPGLYRREDLDEGGHVIFIAIEDVTKRASLEINPGQKSATLRYLAEPSSPPQGPFVTFTETMKSDRLQGLGKKEVEGRAADGYRETIFAEAANQNWSYEFWIDSRSKRLVMGQVPGGDLFDLPNVVPNKIKDPSMRTIEVDGVTYKIDPTAGMGNNAYLMQSIALDHPLDDALFGLEPPEGYVINRVPVPPVTEKDVIEFLGLLAGYFDKVFPVQALNFNHGPEYQRFAKVEYDVISKKGGTDAEVAFVEAVHKWWRAGLPGPGPLFIFASQQVEKGSWKYLGGGVKLGDGNRVVCWYRPKGARAYHVVYGDLSVKEVAPSDLPLPVSP